jgi:ketosteroid isomerase-like protein
MGRASGNGRVGAAERPSSAAATAGRFAAALLGGDPGAAADYFTSDAQLLTPDGTQVAGRESILGVLAQLTAAEPRLEIKTGRTISSGAVALCTQYWKRSSRDLSRERFEVDHVAKLVLIRGADGWQIVIASPWG